MIRKGVFARNSTNQNTEESLRSRLYDPEHDDESSSVYGGDYDLDQYSFLNRDIP